VTICVVPTEQTREIAAAMMYLARQENGADASLEYIESVRWDQIPALVGILLGAINLTNPETAKELPPAPRCKDCRTRKHLKYPGYRLCSTCYERRRATGKLENMRPTRPRPSEQTAADVEELRQQGLTLADAAERLGVTKAAASKALARARRQTLEQEAS